MNPPALLDSLILAIRGQKVLLDADLAAIYGVPTKALNQAIKRNADRFPVDFVFRLSPSDLADMRSQLATSCTKVPPGHYDGVLRSQFVTSKQGGRRSAPYAFTEHGAIMAATVLNSPEAVKMSLFVVRAFVKMREHLAANAEILKRLAEIDKTLLSHDKALLGLWRQIQPLLAPPPEPPRREIGFHVKEKPAAYRAAKRKMGGCR